MKIQESSILLSGQRLFQKEQNKSESLKVWIGSERPDFEGLGRAQSGIQQDRGLNKDIVDLSQNAWGLTDNTVRQKGFPSKSKVKDDSESKDPITRFIRIITELLTGKKIKITPIKAEDQTVNPQKASELSHAANSAQTQQKAGFGLEYDSTETYTEAEYTTFSAHGMVQTTDGKQIQFNLQLSMERVFMSEQSVSVRMGDAVVQQKDPLMINFEGTSAQLRNQKFSFDIDSDGKDDNISFAGLNSGFLALDKNNDSIINNGSELFGTNSGNGFKDLAAYDGDKNGWIDEGDYVFNQLRIWLKDEQGNDSLVTLKAKGIGALYLGNTTTAFDLKDSVNQSLGRINSSGIYLKEDGGSGTMQQVDLTL